MPEDVDASGTTNASTVVSSSHWWVRVVSSLLSEGQAGVK